MKKIGRKKSFNYRLSMVLITLMIFATCTQEKVLANISGVISSLPSDKISSVTEIIVPTEIAEQHIVINGQPQKVEGYFHENKFYLSPENIQMLLSDTDKNFPENITKVEINNEIYVDLDNLAKALDISYQVDNVLDAAYLWTNIDYEGNGDITDDFNRGIAFDMIPQELQRDPERQITAEEYRNLFVDMLEIAAPDKIETFLSEMSDYDKPLLRGEGVMMAYYAATCIGADITNSYKDMDKASDSFWNTDELELNKLFKNVFTGPTYHADRSEEPWRDDFTAAFLWAVWYDSPYSRISPFPFDKENISLCQNEPLTVRDACRAMMRVFDHVVYFDNRREDADKGEMIIQNYVPVSHQKAVNISDAVITPELLQQANEWDYTAGNGFILSSGGGYDNTDILEGPDDLRRIANWGFDSVRLMLTYQTFFDKEANNVDLHKLHKLDELIAAAIRYGLQVELLTFSLPGRWTSTDFATYESTAELDLFTNPQRQEEANRVWDLFAERYKDIPGNVLTFSPLWEVKNKSLSTGLEAPSYTNEDILNVHLELYETIKQHNPERSMTFEPTPANPLEDILKDTGTIYDDMIKVYPDTALMLNFAEHTYVYATMTGVEGAHIDFENQAMFSPQYPVTNYGVSKELIDNKPISLNGELVKGTTIDLYLKKIMDDGTLTISADGETLFKKYYSKQDFETSVPLSMFYPYATSEENISIALEEDVEEITIKFDGHMEICGMDVLLPDEYATERWWFNSAYESVLDGGTAYEYEKWELKLTSNIMISPNMWDLEDNTITIHDDVTFSTETVFKEANKQTIEAWAKGIYDAYGSNVVVRIEHASFSGTTQESALAYYEDIFSAFEKYSFRWYVNDYRSITNAGLTTEQYNGSSYAGAEYVNYENLAINPEMIKLFQKYQQIHSGKSFSP